MDSWTVLPGSQSHVAAVENDLVQRSVVSEDALGILHWNSGEWALPLSQMFLRISNWKLKIEILFIETPTQGPDAADGGVVGTHLEVWPVAVVAAVPRQHRAVGARHVHVVPWDVTHVSRVTCHESRGVTRV